MNLIMQKLLAEQDLVSRLKKRAEIRRQIPGRKSVQEGSPDRISDLLEEAAIEIDRLSKQLLAAEYTILDMEEESKS